nr:hypothetical protein [uncultured archaeon]AQS29494.1 hypothetical protein [uncultured archaeon]
MFANEVELRSSDAQSPSAGVSAAVESERSELQEILVMANGAAIKFTSYQESVTKLLELVKLPNELKKYDKIVLKPHLSTPENSTPVDFTESVLKFVLQNKNPIAEVFIVEGADGFQTFDLFEELKYKELAEKYSIGLIDLNNSETEEMQNGFFLKFQSIDYPKILLESFVITLPKLVENEEYDLQGSLSTMLGAFPASHYKNFYSRIKNKIRKWPMKYSIHDINRCKLPNFSVIDASSKGRILAGLPIAIDKQAAKLLDQDWRTVPHIRTIDENFQEKE